MSKNGAENDDMVINDESVEDDDAADAINHSADVL